MVDGINYICSVLHLYWYTSIGISQNKFYLKLSCSCVAVARTTFSAQHRITQQQQRKNTKFVLSPTHEFKKKKQKNVILHHIDCNFWWFFSFAFASLFVWNVLIIFYYYSELGCFTPFSWIYCVCISLKLHRNRQSHRHKHTHTDTAP